MENNSFIEECYDLVVRGGQLSFDQALLLANQTDHVALYEKADMLRQHVHGDSFDLCSIINAKSGNCSEDCKFCAQSSHYPTEVEEYSLVDIDEAISQGMDNQNNGVKRYSLVTAGKSVQLSQLKELGKIYKRLGETTTLELCASMGMLDAKKAKYLYSVGVRRYHCNLETSKSFFTKVCTTHTWLEKVDTIKVAQAAGMEICSGGILGLGETVEQRVELAFELRELNILSIPINILSPIANTPFEDVPPLTIEDVVTSIALFRFINPNAIVRLAGGRNQFNDDQYQCFRAGANGAIVGNYLTTKGNNLQEDLKTISKMGFDFK